MDRAILAHLAPRRDFLEIVALARIILLTEAQGLSALARVALLELDRHAPVALDGELVSSRRILLALGRTGWINVGAKSN